MVGAGHCWHCGQGGQAAGGASLTVAQAVSRMLHTTASNRKCFGWLSVVWLVVMVWLKFGVSGSAEYTAPHE